MPLQRQPEWTRGTLSSSQRQALTPVLERALQDLHTHLGRPLDRVIALNVSSVRWTTPIALIGFAGPTMVGSLAVGTPFRLLEQTHPLPDASGDDLLDWSREIANLLLGVFKLELLRRGVEIQMGLPTSILADAMELRCSSGNGIAIEGVTMDDTAVQVFSDAAFAPDVELADPPLPPRGSPGDILF